MTRKKNESWKVYAGRLEVENAALRGRVATLEGMVKRLQKRVDELERAGKRQASPFSKGDPKKKPKKPGRKKGKKHGGRASRPKPPRTDETIGVPLPGHCPDPECQGELERVRMAEQFQTDLPLVEPIVRKFRIEIGRCTTVLRSAKQQGRDQLRLLVEAFHSAVPIDLGLVPDPGG